MANIRKLLNLSTQQWYLLLCALFLLPVMGLSIKLLGFKYNYSKILAGRTDIDTGTHFSQPGQSDIQTAFTIARMINIAAAYGLYRANCLCRSLLLMKTLNNLGIPCQLVIGADNDIQTKPFSAHAWVESNGLVLNDSHDVSQRFKTFSLPESLINNSLIKS